jgi:hypothetical protein
MGLLVDEIEASIPRPHHATLLAAAERLIPDCPWCFVLTRGGWYRAGGVVSPEGACLADKLDEWVEREMADCGDDLGEFLVRHDCALLVTRHVGKSHYFVARYGPAPADFLQLEVEELQELLDRQLWDESAPPADAMEITEPINAATARGCAALPFPPPHGLIGIVEEFKADILIAGGRNMYTALKVRIPFLDINQEREFAYAGHAGMPELARQLALTIDSPVWAALRKPAPWRNRPAPGVALQA